MVKYPHCLVMPAGDRSLQEVIDQEQFVYVRQDSRVRGEIKLFILQMIAALDHMHGKGYIHGDVKPKNILRMGDGSFVLIDLDACAKINKDLSAMKYSSAYLPPELIGVSATSGEAFVKSPAVDEARRSEDVVLAAEAHDIWALGIHLCLHFSKSS